VYECQNGIERIEKKMRLKLNLKRVQLRTRQRCSELGRRDLASPRFCCVSDHVHDGGDEEVDDHVEGERARQSAPEHVADWSDGRSPIELRCDRRDDERVQNRDTDARRKLKSCQPRTIGGNRNRPRDSNDKWSEKPPRPPDDERSDECIGPFQLVAHRSRGIVPL
jgi:hypothetical protein